MIEEKIVSKIIEALQYAYSNQLDLFNLYDELEKIYYEKDDKDSNNSIKLNIAHELIETLIAQEVKVIREQESFYTHLRTSLKNKQDEIEAIATLVDYQRKKMKFYQFLIEYLKTAHIYGTAIARIFFKTEQGLKFEYVEKENDNYEIVKKPFLKFYQPFYEVINPYCFFIDPNATNLQLAKWVAVLKFEDIDFLKHKSKFENNKYKNIDKVKTAETTIPFLKFNKTLNSVGLDRGIRITSVDDKLVDVVEFWEKTCDGLKLTEIANGSIIIRELENPYWHNQYPFVIFKDIVEPQRFFGNSVLNVVKGLIKERKEIRNLRLENFKNLVNQTIIGNRNADVDWEHIEDNNKAKGIILTDDIHDTIKFVERPDILRSAYLEDEALNRQIQGVSGVWDYLKGATPPRGETATAIIRLQQSASTRITEKLFRLLDAIDEMTYQHIELNRQFLPRRLEVPIVSKDGNSKTIILTPKDYKFYLEIFPLSGNMTDLDLEVKRQKLIQLLALPIFSQPNVKIETLQRLVIKLFNLGDFEDFFLTEEDILKRQMIQQSLQQQIQNKGVPSIKGVSVPATSKQAPPESKIPIKEVKNE